MNHYRNMFVPLGLLVFEMYPDYERIRGNNSIVWESNKWDIGLRFSPSQSPEIAK